MLAQAKNDPKLANKPEKVLANIINGKIGKFYKENCLLEQEFVKNGDMTVAQYIEHCAKELGGHISVAEFVRYEKGEGIEKKVDDLAAEVAKMVQ